MRQSARPIWWGYLALLHGIVLLACWKTDLVSRFGRRVGVLAPLPPSPAQKPLYQQIQAFQIRVDENVPDGSVLFFGDSLIQGLCVTAVTPNAVNYGIGSDTTQGLLHRLPHYHSLPRCRTAVLAIGVNDFDTYTNAEVLKNYRDLLNAIPIPVIISAVLPVDERDQPRLTGYNTRIRDLNRELTQLCREHSRCQFVDAGGQLVESDGQLAASNHVGDGVHLSPAGNAIWIAALRKVFETHNEPEASATSSLSVDGMKVRR